jgi:aminoglycoside phosphotransferase family enzyme/predicted kinase
MANKHTSPNHFDTADDPATTLRALVNALRVELERSEIDPRCAIFETHISIILLAGEFAYKFKKPVDFGFLDFTTLEKRRHYCQREVELNQPGAGDLYLGVVGVAYDGEHLQFADARNAIEFAVRMRRFDKNARLDVLLERAELGMADVLAVADVIAGLHEHARPAPAASAWGDAQHTADQILATFATLRGQPGSEALEADTRQLLTQRMSAITARKYDGRIRQCHGDLHLSNIVKLGATFVPFDCIEFSDDLSWIDTCSDIAFLLMDLDSHGKSVLANAFFNRYLDVSGDFGACAVLKLYSLYRTLVRAKVAELSLATEGLAAAERRDRHLALARCYLDARSAPALIITHGLSGSGKSFVGAALGNATGYVHVRADVERRRLAGFGTSTRTASPLGDGIYSAEHTEKTYHHLLDVATAVLGAGYSVIIDATFLKRAQRHLFRAEAARLDVPFHILDCAAPQAVLRERVIARERQGEDPSEATLAVLEWQIDSCEALDATERRAALRIGADELDVLLSHPIAQHGSRLR